MPRRYDYDPSTNKGKLKLAKGILVVTTLMLLTAFIFILVTDPIGVLISTGTFAGLFAIVWALFIVVEDRL